MLDQQHQPKAWGEYVMIYSSHQPCSQVITQRELLPDTIDRLKVEIPSPALANACLQKVGSWWELGLFTNHESYLFPSEIRHDGLGPRDEDN